MHRNLCGVLHAAIVITAVGLTGCSRGASHGSPSPARPATTSSAVALAPIAVLPSPEALTAVLSRLVDPTVPSIDKVGLIEGATTESVSDLDKFSSALRDGGYLPISFAASSITWSDRNPSCAMATISVATAHPDHSTFTFPMEFAPFPSPQGGWELSRQTAEMLLTLGNSRGGMPTPNREPSPSPGPRESPAPSPTPSG